MINADELFEALREHLEVVVQVGPQPYTPGYGKVEVRLQWRDGHSGVRPVCDTYDTFSIEDL